MAGKNTQQTPISPERAVATNRKARHEYHIDEKWEAGIVLKGTEVKSARSGGVSIADSYAVAENGEVWLHNLHIQPYDHGNRFNVESKRSRKLLLTKREIRKIAGASSQSSYTLIPLRVYFKGQFLKVEIGLARGKKDYDKRQDIRERDNRREMERAFKAR